MMEYLLVLFTNINHRQDKDIPLQLTDTPPSHHYTTPTSHCMIDTHLPLRQTQYTFVPSHPIITGMNAYRKLTLHTQSPLQPPVVLQPPRLLPQLPIRVHLQHPLRNLRQIHRNYLPLRFVPHQFSDFPHLPHESFLVLFVTQVGSFDTVKSDADHDHGEGECGGLGVGGGGVADSAEIAAALFVDFLQRAFQRLPLLLLQLEGLVRWLVLGLRYSVEIGHFGSHLLQFQAVNGSVQFGIHHFVVLHCPSEERQQIVESFVEGEGRWTGLLLLRHCPAGGFGPVCGVTEIVLHFEQTEDALRRSLHNLKDAVPNDLDRSVPLLLRLLQFQHKFLLLPQPFLLLLEQCRRLIERTAVEIATFGQNLISFGRFDHFEEILRVVVCESAVQLHLLAESICPWNLADDIETHHEALVDVLHCDLPSLLVVHPNEVPQLRKLLLYPEVDALEMQGWVFADVHYELIVDENAGRQSTLVDLLQDDAECGLAVEVIQCSHFEQRLLQFLLLLDTAQVFHEGVVLVSRKEGS